MRVVISEPKLKEGVANRSQLPDCLNTKKPAKAGFFYLIGLGNTGWWLRSENEHVKQNDYKDRHTHRPQRDTFKHSHLHRFRWTDNAGSPCPFPRR